MSAQHDPERGEQIESRLPDGADGIKPVSASPAQNGSTKKLPLIARTNGSRSSRSSSDASACCCCPPRLPLVGLSLVLALQLWSIFTFEASASKLQDDLESSQHRVNQLTIRLSAVERSALNCYAKLNHTEIEVAREHAIISDETQQLRGLSAAEQAGQAELRELRASVQQLNVSLIKSKISLRYEMEERIAAEKAAQASQESVQGIKDQLAAATAELKAEQEKQHRNEAKSKRKLAKAEKKAHEEQQARQKYMEGMLNLQNKLGRTKSMLDKAAQSSAGVAAGSNGRGPERNALEEEDEQERFRRQFGGGGGARDETDHFRSQFAAAGGGGGAY